MSAGSVALEVGRLARTGDRELARRLGAVAAALGDGGWTEPRELARPGWRVELRADAAIGAVRRLAAHLWAEGRLPAPFRTTAPEDALADPLVAEFYASYEDEALGRFWSDVRAGRDEPDFEHLMLHRDDGGLYVPLELENPLQLEDGDLVGSAPLLLDECAAIAGALELDPDRPPDDPTVAAALLGDADGERWMRYGLEAHTLLALCAGARAAVARGAALELVASG